MNKYKTNSASASTMLISIRKDAPDVNVGVKPSMVPRVKSVESEKTAETDVSCYEIGALPLHAFYDALLISDLTGSIRSANERALSLFDYEKDYIVRLHVGNIIFGIDKDLMADILEQIQRRGFVFIDGYCLRFDNSSFPTEIAVSKALISGKEYLCFFIRDVSLRKKTEEQLKDAAKLQNLHMLAGGVAHEISSLLTSVMGYLEMGLAHLSKDSRSRADFQTALEHTKKISNLSFRMRAFAGKGVLHNSVVDVNGAIQRVVSVLSHNIPENVSLNIKPHSSPININGENDLLETVVKNILINAVEAIGRQKGEVTISSALQEIDADFISRHSLQNELKPDVYVCLTISDTGCGIDDVTRSSIFAPFLSTKGQGRGLGLAEVQGIVVVSGGAVIVDTEVGKGSSFTVLLPHADMKKPQAPAAIEPSVKATSGKVAILIVDDDESIRQYLKRVLMLNGYSVFLAESGQKGVDVFRSHADEISLVLLDLIMPDASGSDVLLAIRKIRKTVKLLFVTGYTQDIDPELLEDKYVSGVVHKPFSTYDLLSVIKQALTE